ncbi:hypothetical protein [Pararhizobium gei]|nr:hypothetical protein [Rhizobium gei]
MGFSPQQVRAMSMFQFFAALDGFEAFHNPDDKGLTAKEADELWEFIHQD